MRVGALLTFVFLFVTGVVSQVQSDRTALKAIWDATNGAGWRSIVWDFSKNLCDTTLGITCAGSRVYRIQLYAQNLDGTLPTEIGTLSQLVELTIQQSQNLDGPIPDELGNLTNLTKIDLSGNAFESIPTTIGNLKKLQYLKLTGNVLGNLPSQIGQIGKSLKELYLNSNPIEGTIPTEIGLLTGLTNFYLDSTHLHGPIPSQISNLQGLKELRMYGSQLDGDIPTEIGQMTNLVIIWLSNNNFSGVLSMEPFKTLTKLQKLYLDNNHFTGSIPTAVGQITNLVSLRLMDNQLTGAIPTQIGNLKKLQELFLFQNSLDAPLPNEIGDLSSLIRFWAYQNNITGTIPTQIQNLSNLVQLRLQINSLSGTIPTQLATLSKLTDLWLSFNQLNGTIPTQLASMPSLTSLRLGSNPTTPLPFNETSFSTKLTLLDLSSMNLQGLIPSVIGTLTNLVELNLSNNQLSGPVPTSFLGLTNLKTLNLTSNLLSSVLYPSNVTSFFADTNCIIFLSNYSLVPVNDYSTYAHSTSCPVGPYVTMTQQLGPLSNWRFDSYLGLFIDSVQGNANKMNAISRTIVYPRYDGARNTALGFSSPPADNAYAISQLKTHFSTNFYTIEMVVQFNAIRSAQIFSLVKNPNYSDQSFIFSLSGTSGFFTFATGKNTIATTTSTPVFPFRSYHIVIVKGRKVGSNNVYLYINSVLVASVLAGLPETLSYDNYVLIGRGATMIFDDLAIYDRELTATEIQNHYNTLHWCQAGQCSGSCTAAQTSFDRCAVVPSQNTVLQTFYTATGGNNWKYPGWTTSTDLCNGFDFEDNNHVRCDDLGNVISLSLVNRLLSGTLPSSIGSLPQLQRLTLRQNSLSSTIPTTVGQLTNLQTMDLSFNSFVTPLPTQIGQITSLNALNLFGNKFGCPPPPYNNYAPNTDFSYSWNACSGS